MGLGCSGFVGLGLLIIAGLCYGQGDFRRVGSLGLQYQYSCGEYSMQLMVFPSPGREVRFKLLDEDGIAFEVSNCSICHHWITFHERNVAFSVGYNGCRVLKKDGRMHLKVHLEELTSNRITDARDINMICPKPQEHLLKPEDNLPYVPHPGPASLTQPPQHGRVRPLRPQAKATQPSLMHPLQPQPSLVRPPQSGLVRPLQPQPQQPQPGLVRPSQPEPPKPSLERLLQPQPQPGLELPPQPGLVRPLQPQPGLVCPFHPQPSKPGLVRPSQPQPPRSGLECLLQPQPQPQPGLVRPPQPQPQPGLVRPPQPQPQPGLVRLPQPQPPKPGLEYPPQPQPGLVRPPQPQPQPGLVRPPQPQPQPGLVRPLQPQPPKPGLEHPLQPQPGLVRPLQPQPQPGLVRPLQPQPQPGLVRPLQPQPGLVRPLQPQPQPGLESPLQPQPGLVRPPQPGLERPLQPQPQPGLVRPLQPQPQPGLVRPLQPQPGLVHPSQPQPQPGLERPLQPQPQPGLVRPLQPQPGLVHPSQPEPLKPGFERPLLPQPGIVHPLQPQPGLEHPLQPQPQPSLVRLLQPQPQAPQPSLVRPSQPTSPKPGLERPLQPQPGIVRPLQPQPQPGLVRPVQPQPQPQPPQPGLVRPVQPQPQPPQPGLVRPVQPQPPQPGLVRPVQPQPQPPQPGLVRPVQPQPPQPGLVRPVQPQPQPPQPGLVRPVQPQPQPPQPGLVRPVQPQPQPPQPGLVRPVQPQPQPPQPGLVRPLQPQPQPPQPGLVRPVQPQPPQPGLVRPVQPQPPQPGLERPLQPQPGLVHPLQPGLVHPVPPQPGLVQPARTIGSSLTLEQCQVSSGKIPCVSAEGPAACYHTGCCYDERDQMIPCYYGNTATVQCLQDGYFILAVSRDMLDYPIILDSVKLSYAQGRCDPVRKTESFLLFRFPLTQCGTTVQVTGGRLIYENQLVSGIDILSGPDGFITRDSTFILHARCIYNATDFLPVQGEVFSAPTPAPVIQVGPLRLELRIATDSTYRSYYSDYPVVKVLREPVHVEVRILQRMDPSLVLVLHECWATPSTNPLEQLQWPILAAGCPFKGDNYRTQLVPMGPATSEVSFPNHYQRFIISTFTFVDSAPRMVLDGLVYLFCSVSVCHPSQLEPCRVACQEPVTARGRRFSEMHNGTQSLDLVSTNGAVIFQGSSQSHEKQVKWEKDDSSSGDVTLIFLVLLPLVGIILFVAVLVFWKKKNKF
ncbi:zona pellucida sperm-binding protein 1 [Varanus komodoensis]|uniref:zona pellucida sperm-binding protein 1 n=1 Tax=Varanus komodoensis TaxID=61221 RepID=UPI001CF79558|nr:zona pellucida sperm-binding protein 1 [Varanus komodoensis]